MLRNLEIREFASPFIESDVFHKKYIAFFVTKQTNSERKMYCEQRKGMVSFSLLRCIQVFRQLYNIVYHKELFCIIMKAESTCKMFFVIHAHASF